MPAPDTILRLVRQFREHLPALKGGAYNETQTRVEYIDPFFIALGWDVHNAQGYAPAYQEVIHEDAIKVGGVTKAPDYAFRVGGVRKFFVEAKSPRVDIKLDIHPAFQLRRYAWSAKLPLSILTDFEEFAVYDTRVRPEKNDNASAARILYLRYSEYAERWDEIAAVFTREAIQRGAFDKYVESTKTKKGTAEVDAAFLAEIERWRELLARNFALRNPALAVRELNFAVQQTIDRIVFLRICEDRGIEPYATLQGLLNGANTYARLVQIFHQADHKYNSGLFHFEAEKGRAGYPDTLTTNLALDDRALKEILKNLYYPDSPYEFSVLSADILGQVYEQFLGKVITLSDGRRATVEERPEVKKAGGVYYTPTYIVDYIVRQTVGKLVEGRKAGPRGGVSRLRIVDPACGSGSFLLGAYQFLLDWHLNQYVNDPAGPETWARKSNPQLYQTERGEWRLTVDERKRILLNNVYGVDIDPQAVEVTKLSLLLKVLEGESAQTLSPQLALLPDRVLPDLAHNVRCGNSLIGPDFYAGAQAAALTPDELQRVNPFDWRAAFPEVFAEGGFDAVIGNPPYIRIQAMKEWAPVEVEFYKKAYESAAEGNFDIYIAFIEKAIGLLQEAGRLGYIVSHRFFKRDYAIKLRALLQLEQLLEELVDFDGYMVFANASINTCIIILSRNRNETFSFSQVHFTTRPARGLVEVMDSIRLHPETVDSSADYTSGSIRLTTLNPKSWNFVWPRKQTLWEKLVQMPVRLADATSHVFQGIKTGADTVFTLELLARSNRVAVRCLENEQQYELETGLLRSLVKIPEMRRYALQPSDRLIIFPYRDGVLIPEHEMRSAYPATMQYLRQHKKLLESRDRGKMADSQWYSYSRNQALSVMNRPKIITPDYYAHASYCLDPEGSAFFSGGGAGGYGILVKDGVSDKFVLGLLNSKLLDWYLHKISVRAYQTAYMYTKAFIEQLPIRAIDPTVPADVARHDRMVGLVQRMLELHQQLAAASTPFEKERVQRQIEATDRQIDALVYELYGLTEAEIRIVEGAGGAGGQPAGA